jgi:hypothetical protein
MDLSLTKKILLITKPLSTGTLKEQLPLLRIKEDVVHAGLSLPLESLKDTGS